MNNQEILKIAMEQSARDAGCKSDDFCKKENVIAYSVPNDAARRYLELPLPCNLIYYGNNIVASIMPEYETIVRDYINRFSAEHCFETPNMHVLNDAFDAHNMRVCFMAEYFLPDADLIEAVLPELMGSDGNKLLLRVLKQSDFENLYLPQWSNALCEKRKHLDVIGVGCYDGEKLVGLAGASADCDTMWQIGIDVLPEYRRLGIASTITRALAREVLKEGKVPFYCAAWSNIKSVRNAIKSGFRPAWVEMTVKPKTKVDEMNNLE